MQDLLDYLTLLLGVGNLEAIRVFVRDVDRARRGLSIRPDAVKEVANATPQNSDKPVALKVPPQKKKSVARNVPSLQSPKNNSQSAASNNKVNNGEASAETRQSILQSKTVEKPAIKSKPTDPPPKGKAKYDCGCFGTLHRALTNCLYCGRITCEKEGNGFCPFCGYLVEEVVPPSGGDQYVTMVGCIIFRATRGRRTHFHLLTPRSVSIHRSSTDEAWKHKERLLRYDREFAQRTIILDDQSDYYNRQTSMWSTDEEQAEAARLEQERHDDIHKRTMHMTLGI